jgi:hypothetical protein
MRMDLGEVGYGAHSQPTVLGVDVVRGDIDKEEGLEA